MADKEDDIEGYYKESLSDKERHALEKKALSDPFLENALEGAESISPEEFSADLLELSGKIERRRTITWFKPLRIAAGFFILLSAGSLFYYLNLPEPVTLALEKSTSTSVLSDSITTSAKDSSSKLLTLAKPDETEKNEDKTSGPSPTKNLAHAAETTIKREPLTSSGAGSANLQPLPTLAQIDEEKKSTEEEVAKERDIAPKSIQEAPAVSLSQLDTKKDLASISKKESQSRKAKAAYSSDAPISYRTFTGKVISADDGGPLSGVNVIVKGSSAGAVTDADGNFIINTDEVNPQLVFSFIGMSPVEAKPSAEASMNIKMKEDASQLSEVVVTALGLQSDDKAHEPVIRSAFPVGGLKAYNKYLENNLRYPSEALEQKIKGKVLIEFTVETNGDLSEFNVLRGLGHGCDEEVIRLVKEGPKWSPTTQDDVPVEAQVKVRMKFDPAKAER